MELFNVLNLDNVEIAGAASTNFCASPVPLNCGFLEPTNPNFLQLRDRAINSPRRGLFLLNNIGGDVFQMQFGARFNF
jgi:hypothetical protein